MAVTSKTNQSKLVGAIKWFDVRRRDVGMWAFALNRITAIGLVVYLFLHLIVLGKLAGGPEAYDSFIAIVKSPMFIFAEWLVVVGGLYHGLNGLRIGLTSFGIAVPYQKQIFYVLFVIAVLGSLIFGIRMFTA